LHGGSGTRLRPLTFSVPKQLILIANKPVGQYVLEELRDAGVKDVVIVLGETFLELVKEHYGDAGGEKLSERSLTRAKNFTWQKAAKDYLGVYSRT